MTDTPATLSGKLPADLANDISVAIYNAIDRGMEAIVRVRAALGEGQ